MKLKVLSVMERYGERRYRGSSINNQHNDNDRDKLKDKLKDKDKDLQTQTKAQAQASAQTQTQAKKELLEQMETFLMICYEFSSHLDHATQDVILWNEQVSS
jgi:dephospho-CoA kinase